MRKSMNVATLRFGSVIDHLFNPPKKSSGQMNMLNLEGHLFAIILALNFLMVFYLTLIFYRSTTPGF